MENKPKQTAVQWLVNTIAEGYNKKGSLPFSDILILVDKALEIEKDNIINFTADWSQQWKKHDGVSIMKYYSIIFERNEHYEV